MNLITGFPGEEGPGEWGEGCRGEWGGGECSYKTCSDTIEKLAGISQL